MADNIHNTDLSSSLVDQVKAAIADNKAIEIVGGGSKSNRPDNVTRQQSDPGLEPAILEVAGNCGIVSYEPTELVVTVRNGTTIAELKSALAEQGQCLPFEPPNYTGADTIGGVIACGLSGPARPYAGSARDYVLGLRLINGKGEYLRFGGEVMKNVAGYDVSRLQVGARGTLGVITEISMKVLPMPQAERTVVRDVASHDESIGILVKESRKPLPVSASACIGDQMMVRLSGSEAAVEAATDDLTADGAGTVDEQGNLFWAALCDQKQEFFTGHSDLAGKPRSSDTPTDPGTETLWRMSVPDYTAQSELADLGSADAWLLEWGGAQRWLRSTSSPAEIYQHAEAVGGHASGFKAQVLVADQPLTGVNQHLHQQLKQAFDPQQLFNRRQ